MLQLDSPKAFIETITPPHSVTVKSRVSPILRAIAYPLCGKVILPLFFQHIEVIGQELLPSGDHPLVLAPTHRSRWDALIVPYAAGWPITGRDLHFMVSANEVKREPQGWFIRRLGGFPVDPEHPAISSLRHGVELLQAKRSLVIFPEGNIYRDNQIHPLKLGLARLTLQAEANSPNLGIQIVPIHIAYSQTVPQWGSDVQVEIGSPLTVADYQTETPKQNAQKLTADLELALNKLAVESSNYP